MSEDCATGLFQEKFAMGNTVNGVLMMSKKRHRKTPRNLNALHNNFFVVVVVFANHDAFIFGINTKPQKNPPLLETSLRCFEN